MHLLDPRVYRRAGVRGAVDHLERSDRIVRQPDGQDHLPLVELSVISTLRIMARMFILLLSRSVATTISAEFLLNPKPETLNPKPKP